MYARAGFKGLRNGFLAGAGSCAVAFMLTGCGKGNFGTIPTPVPPPTPVQGPTFSVKVLSGTTPLAGFPVSLYAAGTSGNGSAGTALLSAAVVTDVNGMASIPASYTCPTGAAQTYLVATGATGGNSNVKLMAALGACSSVTAGSTTVVNEVTTVAAAYALTPFYNGGSIGASKTNLQGLTNAFLTAATLANASTGSSSGTSLPANGQSPAARVNSLANALNACLVKSSNCAGLYAAGGTTPANTLDALVALVRSPASSVAAIYAESALSTAYASALTSQPTDWTMFITYSGGGLTSPTGLAVDSTGAVWVSNYFGAASKFSPIGAAIFPSGISGYGLNNSYGIAIDLKDNVWIPNEQPYQGGSTIGSVTELTSAGAPLSGQTGYTAGGMNYPTSVGIDPNGTAWVVQFGNSHVTLLNPSGVPLSGSAGYTEPSFAFPITVVVDGNHIGWIGDQDDQTITRMSADASSVLAVNCCNGASGMAVDSQNNLWAANFFGNSVSLISSNGAVISRGGFLGAGSLYRPQGIAVDGAGNVFVTNYRAPYITELSGISSASPGASISPATGYGADSGLLEAYALAVDASGNIWISNEGNDTVTKFIGLAVPVKTPVSGAAQIP